MRLRGFPVGLFSFFNKKPQQEAPAATPAEPERAAPEADVPGPPMLCRHEIIDDKGRLCGYRYAFQGGDPDAPPPETAFFEALGGERIPEFAARRLAVIPLTLDAIVFKRHLPLIAPNTVFLIDREQARMSAQQLAGRLRALREWGCKLALRGVSMEQSELPLLEVCDIVFLHLGETSLNQFQAMTHQLTMLYPTLKLAADGVQSWDEQRMCVAWGCQYCLGSFLTTQDRSNPNGKVEPSRMASMELLNLLRGAADGEADGAADGAAELDELTTVAKRDPAIVHHMLKLANSPADGQAAAITSLSQAIAVLGHSKLYRWLTVAMFRLGGARERDEALLEVALTRARFLELLAADALSVEQRDEMFLVGLLSLFDVLLAMPMEAALASMHLSEDVRDVLLRSTGRYGQYLMLALLIERGLSGRAAQIAEALGIAPDTLAALRTNAFHWAQASLQSARNG
jgi:c-di-GMP phosphodiesterase